MDSNVEKLLEKYWAAETSLEEEQELKNLIESTDTNEGMDEMQAVFAHFEEEKAVSLGASFDEELLGMLEEKAETKVISFSDYFRRYASIAAAVLVLLTSSYLFIQNQNSYQAEDTFESPEAALEEVKRQLLQVSMYMNKGNEQISELSGLGKADMTLGDLAKMNQAGRSMQSLSRMNITQEISN